MSSHSIQINNDHQDDEAELIQEPFHAVRPKSPFPKMPDLSLRLGWQDLEITTIDGSRKLLQGISGHVKGTLRAIMGPTGAGKTTFMNLLARRVNGVRVTMGEMEIDGAHYDRHILKGISGYVMQDDILFENLTVRETLEFAAKLRLPAHFTNEQRTERVR